MRLDGADNIPGIENVGKVAADKIILDILKSIQLEKYKTLLEGVKDYYFKWHHIVLKEKQLRKLEVEYIKQYKLDNDIKSISAKKKSEALKDFAPIYLGIKTNEEVNALFEEQYTLLYLLSSKKEGKKYSFSLTKPIKCDKIDWEEVIEYQNELEEIDYETDDLDLDILNEL